MKFSFAHCFHAIGNHAKLPESSDKPLFTVTLRYHPALLVHKEPEIKSNFHLR